MADENRDVQNVHENAVRNGRTLMENLQDTIVNITSAFKSWKNAKTNWINIKAFNKAPVERPSTPTLCPRKQELLWSVFLENKQNLQQSQESEESDCNQKLNGFYLNHLLLIHEEFCKYCYSNSSDELTDTNQNNVSVTNNIPPRKSCIKIQTSKDKITKNGCALFFKSNKKTQTAVKNGSSKGKKYKKTKDLSKTIRTKRSEFKQCSVESDSNGQISNLNENSNSGEEKMLVNSEDLHNQYSVFKISEDEWENAENDCTNVSLNNSSSNESDNEASHSNTWNKYKFKCELCDKIFHRPGRLKDHIDCQHGGKKFKCEICKKEYSSSHTLKEHMLEHTEKPKPCPECGKLFMSPRTLTQHLKTHEPIDDTWKCHECGKNFFSKHTLKNHKALHLDVKNFCCDICGKRFKRNTYLTIHRALHTGDITYNCDICQASFNNSGQLYKHKKKKHGERDQLCIVCGKAFFTSELLKRHERIHSKDPYYKCGDCGKGYRSETAYRVHLNSHKGITPKPQKRRSRKKLSLTVNQEQVPTLALSSQSEKTDDPPQPSYTQYAYEEFEYI